MIVESLATEPAYPDSVTSFFLENLPEQLLRQFIFQKSLRMPLEAIPSFAARFDLSGIRRTAVATKALLGFAHELDTLMREFTEGCFVRLGSRSAKDASETPKALFSAKEVLMLFDRSDRIRQDVGWCVLYEYSPVFWVRPWKDIPPWQEYRCIVKNDELYGISQYYTQHFRSFPEICSQAKLIKNVLGCYIREQVIPHSFHKNFVCDVVYSNSDPMILDYNPLTAGTGLGLFERPFSAPQVPQFRYIKSGTVLALSL